MACPKTLLCAVALSVGCIGSVGSSPAPPAPGPPDTMVAPPGMPPAMVDPMNGPMVQSCVPSVAPAPLRRLSHWEYQQTLAALVGGVGVAAPVLVRDPSEHGFENRASLLNPSPLLVEQYGAVAEEVGVKVAGRTAAVAPCTPASAAEERSCGERFVESFGARVFRRPLTAEEKADYVAFFEQERAASDWKGAVQLTTEVLLQAPQLLYRLELGEPASPGEPDRIALGAHEVATRLSYLVTGGPPDQALADAAGRGELARPEQREQQARRLLGGARAGAMMVEFHRQWLDFDRLEREPKDAVRYPGYDEALRRSIREESDRLVQRVLWQGDGRLATFLTSNQAEVDAPLARLYGAPAPASGWGEVALDPAQRAGWLTRANFLASRAHQLEGSPPLRSVFVLERLLCLPPPEPPADANLAEPRASAGSMPLTNRELFQARIAPPTCQACHSQIDTIGYGLEHYDAIGAYRTVDSGRPVDARGEIKGTDVDGPFTGGVELSRRLADSKAVQICAARSWFQFAVGRTLGAEDECRLGKLGAVLADSGGDVRELLVALVKSPEFVWRRAP
jgi:hypothetical protein